ncbi:MmgE/PrpD family protein [Caldivirga maquilingensis]|uniref:2-methylcitrate dehydratase n=1 Tax=Caldivirga maquilingensis (strain ATCC 700844 / DSM 13496 / JCM 10307 / IC-167) TaxID=397948 RepID=A8MCZ9_CALMQ|nr:MmgE/PrpD family protein [Caldivirga maquilingensis]ABW01655.1 2-methylcitrate dehydratase [Caldivirga maquilingensis IC-167]
MPKDLSEVFVDYAMSIGFDDLPTNVVKEVKRRILDSLGVALASYSAEPVKYARLAALGFRGNVPIIGSSQLTTVDWAAFINTLMVRYLDFNDTYLSKEPLHPSDMIGTALAVSQYLGSSGKEVITALAIGYEAGVRLCDAASLRAHGWDHVNYTGIGHLLVAGKLMRVNREAFINAIAIHATSHLSTRQNRVGELSHWKAAATANQARNAVFSVVVASHGLTGPDKPFEGEMGFIRQLLGGEFDYGPMKDLENLTKPSAILRTYIKPYPVEYHAQSAVEASLRIRSELGAIDPSDVESISIRTFKAAYDIIVKDPEKWNPKTKETADHSLMWAVATALINGDLWLSHYEPSRIRDPRVLELIKRIKVTVDPELDKQYPQATPTVVSVKLRNGKETEVKIDYPKGHPMNPMSDDEVEGKFRRLTTGLLTVKQQDEVIRVVWGLEDIKDLASLIKATVI